MRRAIQGRRTKVQNSRPKVLIGLSAIAGLLSGAPMAGGAVGGSGLGGAWKQVTLAANTFEVFQNATACVRCIVEYAAAIADRVVSCSEGAFQAMTPIFQIAFVVILLRLLKLMFKQALAHLVLKGVEERLSDLPGDRNVLPSPGIGNVAMVMTPQQDRVTTECRAWFPIRRISITAGLHPVIAAQSLRRIAIAEASVHDLRCITRGLRACWLYAEDRAVLDYVQMRSFDLREFADCSGETERSAAPDFDGPCEEGEVR